VPLKGRPDIANSQARTVRISAGLAQLLREYREWLMSRGLFRKDGYVFPSRTHGHVSQRNVARALEVEAAKYEIRRELNGEVGPKPIHPHAFRHAYASRLYSTGTPLEKISVWLGHSSIDVTRKRYARIIDALANVETEDAWLEAAGL
jgi:integrase